MEAGTVIPLARMLEKGTGKRRTINLVEEECLHLSKVDSCRPTCPALPEK